ncbi:NYN domain-containing protein [Brevibacillus borstelensis]|uniref:NYN domain-containing protein n=1 Tax=Brevibacillus borstelensis TaxID=45462 RepID=UPI0030C3D9A3
MGKRIALFIDGGYLDSALIKFGKVRIDYSRIVEALTENLPLLRAYYYHCLPYQSSTPTETERQEFSAAEKFQRRLNRLDSFTVRRGRLAFRGIDDKGKSVFEQERVDVALATDLVMHSTKRLISHAVMITGDSDFIPAVEIAQSEGVHITLYYAQNSLPHDELLDAVDARKLITQDMVNEWKR